MAKQLKDILNGVKSSKKMPASLGKDPGVDYRPKAGDEADFADKHEIEKHDDRVGNGDDVYKGTDVKNALDKETRHGYKKNSDKKVYEAAIKSEAKCNMTEAGTNCPVHGLKECSSMKPIKEDELDEAGKAEKYRHDPGGDPLKNRDSYAKQHKTPGKVYKDKMHNTFAYGIFNTGPKKKLPEEADQIDEKLTKSTTAGETIHDFVHSKDKKFSGDSKKQRIKRALGAYYAKQNENYDNQYYVGEDLAVPLVGSGSDEGAEMVKAELKALASKAMHLMMQMPDSMHVEPWVQAKVAQAKGMVNDVHDYCVYGNHDKKETEQTDTPYTPPSNPTNSVPDFSADVNTGRNV